MTKRLLPCMLILLGMCLCACEANGAKGEDAPQPPLTTKTNVGGTELKLVTSSEGMFGLAGAVSENGYYDIRFNEDGSGNIVYTDFDTAQTIYLSSEVTASHTSEEDSSWFEDGVNYLFTINDKLYAVYPGALYATSDAADIKQACVYEMQLNGSGRRILTEFGSGKYMMRSVVTDGKAFYTIIEAVTPLGQNINELTKVDLETGEQEVLCTMPPGEFIIGAFEDQLILKNVIEPETETLRLSTFSLNNLEQKEIISLGGETISGVAYQDSFYYIDHTRKSFFCTNLATGETEMIQENLPVESKQVTFTSGIWKEYFVYRVTTLEEENESQQLYGINIDSGAVYKNSITYRYQGSIDHSVNIIATTQNQYLFVRDRIDAAKTFYTADGTAYQAIDTKFIYGLEDVSTFWSDMDQGRTVEDLT